MHGSKKWIKDYRGRIKRSNNRTKIDYYAGLKAWDIHYSYGFFGMPNKVDSNVFCPQCKHVQKAILNDMEGYLAAKKRAEDEWKKLYGDKHYYVVGEKDPKNQWRTRKYFWDFFRERSYYVELWHYDFRNYLCYKHERMYEQERAMWRGHYLGEKSHYGLGVRTNWKKYRAKCRNVMQKAKYDEDYYDQMPDYKHEWLD